MTSAVAAVVLLATFTVVWAKPPSPCFRAQMPNDEDPYSFYKCDAGGKAHLWRCAAGTMYDRRTQICDWEDQVRRRNGQVGTGGSGSGRPNNGAGGAGGGRPSSGAGNGRPSTGAGGNRGREGPDQGLTISSGPNPSDGSSRRSGPGSSARAGYSYGSYKYYGHGGGGGKKDYEKISKYVAHLDWKSIAHKAAYAYHKVKPILDSMYDHHYEHEHYQGKDSKNKGNNREKYNEKYEYKVESSEGSEEEYYRLTANKVEGGRRPNRPVNRDPGPTDDDSGGDWGEMESWRDQFRESENLPPRDRETPREPAGGRNPSRRVDCSARADGPGAAPRMYPNPDDCSTFFTCNMRRPVLTYCPRGLNYNPRRGGCDDSDPPNCRTIRGTQTPINVHIYNRRLLPHDPLINGNYQKPQSEEEIVLPTRR